MFHIIQQKLKNFDYDVIYALDRGFKSTGKMLLIQTQRYTNLYRLPCLLCSILSNNNFNGTVPDELSNLQYIMTM